MKWVITVLAIAGGFVLFNRQSHIADLNYNVLDNRTVFEVKGSDYEDHFRYELDSNPITLDGVAAMTGRGKGIKEGGALLTLHMLSHPSAELFDRTYGRSKNCPAPFFNKHANQKILFAANNIIEEQIINWNLRDYRESDRWEDFSIKGHCIKGLKEAKLDGETVFLNPSFFNNCRFVLVNELSMTMR